MRAILPPERVIAGGDLSWLKDLKDTTSFKEVSRDDRGVMVSINESDVEGLMNIKNAFQATSITFWGLIEDLLKNGNVVSPYAGIWDLHIFIYADATILDEEVPEGLPNRLDGEVVRTFGNWYNNPIGTGVKHSNDESKVILLCNIDAKFLTMPELIALIDYGKTQTATDNNVELLCTHHFIELLNSPEFYTENEI